MLVISVLIVRFFSSLTWGTMTICPLVSLKMEQEKKRAQFLRAAFLLKRKKFSKISHSTARWAAGQGCCGKGSADRDRIVAWQALLLPGRPAVPHQDIGEDKNTRGGLGSDLGTGHGQGQDQEMKTRTKVWPET